MSALVRIPPCVQSVLEVEVLDGFDPEFDDEDMAILATKVERVDGAVRLKAPATVEERAGMFAALTDLANAADELLEGRHGAMSSNDRIAVRNRRDALGATASRVLRMEVGS